MGLPAVIPLQPREPLPRPAGTAPSVTPAPTPADVAPAGGPPPAGSSRWARLRYLLRTAFVGGRRGTTVAVLCALLALPAAVGAWALSAPAGAVGHDVSYPQCGTSLPTGGTFGIVGVNGGRVSTANPCLATQYAWASGRRHGAALYVNTGNPGAISTFYWPANGAREPALCTDRTSSADPGCAYDYGWRGARNSLQIATNALGAGVTARSWWLDVELANSWNGTGTANAAALQGAVDALRSAGIATVGIYSTSYQWGQITGGYRASNAATYRAAWAGAFTPRYPMESAPLWIAGLSSVDAAASNCSSSFTGAPAMIAQYTDGGVDGDLMCGGAPSPPVTTPTPTPTPTTSTSRPSSSPSSTATVPTSAATPPVATTVPSSPTTTVPTTTPTTTTPTTTTPTTTTPTTTTPGTTTPGTTTPGTTTPGTTTPGTTTTAPSATTSLTPTTTPTSSAAGPARVPGAPVAVAARTHPTRGIQLSWAAPTVTGGAPVTRYYVWRGTAPGRETLLGYVTCPTTTCVWQDPTVTGGRVAYYQLVAINTANAIGPRSAEVVARGR